jgi:hypothetical protein
LPKNSESAIPVVYASSSDSTFMASAKVGNGSGCCKFTVVALDYFTKWVGAKALANITAPIV